MQFYSLDDILSKALLVGDSLTPFALDWNGTSPLSDLFHPPVVAFYTPGGDMAEIFKPLNVCPLGQVSSQGCHLVLDSSF